MSGWNKISNALQNTFVCTPVFLEEGVFQKQVTVYPNPTTHTLHVEWNEPHTQQINQEELLYNLVGENMSKQVDLLHEGGDKAVLDVHRLSSGLYLLMLNNSIVKGHKN